MESSQVLKYFFSSDSHNIWLASQQILRSNQVELEKHFLPFLPAIRIAISSIEDTELRSPSDYRNAAKMALRLLEAINEGKCRCVIYSFSDNLLALDQMQKGFIKVLEQKQSPYMPETICECLRCQKKFHVVENHCEKYSSAQWSLIAD